MLGLEIIRFQSKNFRVPWGFIGCIHAFTPVKLWVSATVWGQIDKSKLESSTNIFTNRGILLANLTPKKCLFQTRKWAFRVGEILWNTCVPRLTQEFGWEEAEWTRQSKSWVCGSTSGAWGGDQQCQCGAIGDVPLAGKKGIRLRWILILIADCLLTFWRHLYWWLFKHHDYSSSLS